jgi:hypothetical protein
MAKQYPPIDLTKLRTFSIGERTHKFDAAGAVPLPDKGATFQQWLASLPPQLAVVSLEKIVDAIVAARRADRPVIFALGAHVVKVGCAPVICDLLQRGIVTAVAMNGATAIHDVEVALFGQTSEDVADTIRDGRFGMVQETPAFFADACATADPGAGLGRALGNRLRVVAAPNAAGSILAACARLDLPATVHVALGTDTIHMHASVAGSKLAPLSNDDFRLICSVVADMAPAAASPGQGAPAAGVWCNVGSAVLLPEVFLKAVAVARNLGHNLDGITTANFDMVRHYRPSENVIGRPVARGAGHHVSGHHEIMLPLLRQALIERM